MSKLGDFELAKRLLVPFAWFQVFSKWNCRPGRTVVETPTCVEARKQRTAGNATREIDFLLLSANLAQR